LLIVIQRNLVQILAPQGPDLSTITRGFHKYFSPRRSEAVAAAKRIPDSREDREFVERIAGEIGVVGN